jgi:hypothetical protein
MTGIKVNVDLSKELQNKTAEHGMEEDHQPDIPSTDGTENSIQEIESHLRMIQDPERDYSWRPETTLTNNPEKGCDDTTAVPIDLFEAWMEYVYSEGIKNGLYDRLPQLRKGRCKCNKSGIGYPHWPPTSFDEAKVQFDVVTMDDHSAG